MVLRGLAWSEQVCCLYVGQSNPLPYGLLDRHAAHAAI